MDLYRNLPSKKCDRWHVDNGFSWRAHPAYRKSWAGIVPGGASHPTEKFATRVGTAADYAATLVLVHSGPAAAETASYGYEVIHPPNSPASHVCQMYSDHPGGANVVNGDGSVRFVQNSSIKMSGNLSQYSRW